MIGTSGAAVLILVNTIFASALGICAGGLTGLVLRRPWSLKAAVIDGVLAAVVAVIAAYVLAAIDSARGVLESRVALVLAIATASIVVRHLMRLAVRSAN
jgi:hypothetical protein